MSKCQTRVRIDLKNNEKYEVITWAINPFKQTIYEI